MSERDASPVPPPPITPVIVQIWNTHKAPVNDFAGWAWSATDADWEAGTCSTSSPGESTFRAIQAALVAIPAALPLVLKVPADSFEVIQVMADPDVDNRGVEGLNPDLFADLRTRLLERQVEVQALAPEDTAARGRAEATLEDVSDREELRRGPGFSLNPAG